MSLSGEQIRAARALARLGQGELAEQADVSLETVKRLEAIRGPVSANPRTLARLERAFRALGVVFDPLGGVGLVQRRPDAALSDGGSITDQRLHRLIYHSTMSADPSDTATVLTDILTVSRRNNAAEGLTGALIAASGRFLQVLEGSETSIDKVFVRITGDPRHGNLQVIERRSVGRRHFPDWSLCCGELHLDKPALAAEPALASGFRPETLSPSAALGLLAVLRDLAVDTPSAR